MLPTPTTDDVVWLVTVYAGGTPIRLASRAVTVTDAAAGSTYVYAPGVASLSVSEEMGDPGADAPEVSVSVSILEPTDAAILARRGQGIALRVAEVALWVEGTDWARREVKVTGTVENPEWGLPGEPISFTVAARLWEDLTEVPGPTQRVDGTTWANASTVTAEHLGRPYPIIIGRPGVVSTTVAASGRVEASRGVWAEHDPLYTNTSNHAYGTPSNGFVCIVAGHHVSVGDNGTYGGRVYTTDRDGQNEARMRIRNGYDNRGQPIAWLSWWSTYTSAPADQYDYDGNTPGWSWSTTDTDSATTYGIGHATANNAYVTEEQQAPFLAWLDDIDGGGGLEWQGRMLENAADVVAWAVSQTGQNVDLAAVAEIRTALEPFKVAAVIEGPSTAAVPAGGSGTVSDIRQGRNRLSFSVNADAPALIFVSQIWYPGWRVIIDGAPAGEPWRTNYLFQGVAVPAGQHQVELTFSPALWRVGWVVAAIGLLGIVGLAVWARRRNG